MNLQTIQKRIEELQAELLTVSNDLAFLIAGEVSRTAVSIKGLSRFTEVVKGDALQFVHPFVDIDGDTHNPGTYVVADVERGDYDGYWSVEVRKPSTGRESWINFNSIAAVQPITKVGA